MGEELLAPYGYEYWSDVVDPEAMFKAYVASRTADEMKAVGRMIGPFYCTKV